MGRAGWLDAIRAAAAFGVLAYHAQAVGLVAFPGVFGIIAANGHLGVPVFFVLSGYLMYGQLLAPAPRRRSTVGFWLRRAFRIVPAYACALVGVTLVTGDRSFVAHPVEFLLFAQNATGAAIGTPFLPTWTLPIEMAFYLVLPVLSILVGRTSPRILLLIAAVSFVLLLGIWANWPVPALLGEQSFATWAWAFVPGMLLARLAVRPAGWVRLAVVGGGLGLLAFAIVEIEPIKQLLAALGAALLIAGLSTARAPLERWLSAAAGLSYAFYLWHVAAISIVLQAGLAGGIGFAAAIGLALAAAVVSWRLVERPALEIGRRLEAWVERGPASRIVDSQLVGQPMIGEG